MLDDSKRWDLIHQKNTSAAYVPNHYAEEVEKQFPRRSLIVELGAGTGADALFFLRKGHSVIALDISQFALGVLEKKAKDASFTNRLVTRQVDFGLHSLPIKDASVDIAYSRISLNYFGAKQTAKIFADIWRVLKPGGKAYLTLKSPEDTMEWDYLQKSATLYEPNVFIEGGLLRSRFTVEQLKEILIAAKISQFEVRPLVENLERHGEDHNPRLFVNEVRFTKS